MPAQFIVVPPLAKVSLYFREATGKSFTPFITWTSWNALSNETYTDIETYIRPCHSSIFDSTRNGNYDTPCALMRQLLRPHGLRIDYRNNVWTLREIEGDTEKGIRTKSGCLIIWD